MPLIVEVTIHSLASLGDMTTNGNALFCATVSKEANECVVTPAITGIFTASFANVKRILLLNYGLL
jgi:hypothetical protein